MSDRNDDGKQLILDRSLIIVIGRYFLIGIFCIIASIGAGWEARLSSASDSDLQDTNEGLEKIRRELRDLRREVERCADHRPERSE